MLNPMYSLLITSYCLTCVVHMIKYWVVGKTWFRNTGGIPVFQHAVYIGVARQWRGINFHICYEWTSSKLHGAVIYGVQCVILWKAAIIHKKARTALSNSSTIKAHEGGKVILRETKDNFVAVLELQRQLILEPATEPPTRITLALIRDTLEAISTVE
jgi:hypothetical protein